MYLFHHNDNEGGQFALITFLSNSVTVYRFSCLFRLSMNHVCVVVFLSCNVFGKKEC